MRKDELRKLRKLNATPAMVRLAADNEGKCERIESWGSTECMRKYGIFMRAQHLGKYLKIAIFLPNEVKKGRMKPRFEVFINVEGCEYITREWGEDETELWRTARIDNLDFRYYSRVKSRYAGYMYHSQKDAWMEPSQARSIAKTLKSNGKNGYRTVMEYQQRIQKQNIEARERREQEPWDKDMALVPEKTPAGFEKWWQKEVIKDHFIFYTYEKNGAKTGYCSYCDSEVELKERPKHNKESRYLCHR